MGNTILPLAHQILGLLVRTNAARGYKRLALMQETSAQLDLLKIFVRLAKDTHAMTDKNYIQLQGHLNETGKMLGGWIKAQATGTKRPPMNTEDDRGM